MTAATHMDASGSRRREQANLCGVGSHGAVDVDAPAGLLPALVGLRSQHRARGATFGSGVPASQVGFAFGVRVADEALALAPALALAELLLEARHHARAEAAPFAIGSYCQRALVVAPETLGGFGQERVHVG